MAINSLAPLLTDFGDIDQADAVASDACNQLWYINQFGITGDEDRNVVAHDDEDDVALYKGRWFFMIPLSQKFMLYSLTEMQPIYDFEESEFSFWIAPELGKMFDWGAAYVKPGFGVDNSLDTDRDWTLEIGFRYFY